ncbi:MAG: ABC transporter permease [Flammeovirgaceae bacterium]|nr:ABC transporter permease [Flammeovirgaceae bacterium]
MLNSYLKIAIRNLLNKRIFSFINIFGLAIGMAAFLFILQYVNYESSFDSFYETTRQLYRVNVSSYNQNKLVKKDAYTVPALGNTIENEVPGVLGSFRLHSINPNYVLAVKNDKDELKSFHEQKLYFADPECVAYLDLHFLTGNKLIALQEPNKLLMSEKAVRKYFGQDWEEKDVLGEMIDFFGESGMEGTFMLEGIFQDFPQNSHLEFDFLVSFKSLTDLYIPKEVPEEQRANMIDNSWGPPQFYTYLLLEEKTDPELVASKVSDLVQERNKQEGTFEDFQLQAIHQIHFSAEYENEPGLNVNPEMVQFLLLIGVFILVLAWVNYINLSTSRSAERAKEVGVRRVIGAGQFQLVIQFLVEALLLNLIAIIFALGIFVFFRPYLSDYIDFHATVPLWNIPWFWTGLALLLGFGILATGLYPALLISTFQPVNALKNKVVAKSNGSFLRKILVVFQFIISIGLVIGTLTIYRQVQFMKNQDLGFQIEQTIVIKSPKILAQRQNFGNAGRDSILTIFRNELEAYPQIDGVTATNILPGSEKTWGVNITRTSDGNENLLELKMANIDYQYLPKLGVDFLTGMNFSGNFEKNKNSVILNEEAVNTLGFLNNNAAVGEMVGVQNAWGINEFEVAGVVKNFHYSSLANEFQPMVFFHGLIPDYYLVKLDAGKNSDLKQGLQLVEEKYKALFPGNPFEYFFLDNFFDQQYKNNIQQGKLFLIFSLLAIIIASFGLFGLTSFLAQQRTKEIGIRKVLGANLGSILILMSKAYLKLVLAAIVITIPIANYFVIEWLNNFAFRIELSWWLYVIPGIAMLLLVIVAVITQSLKVAITNPVESLRNE